VGDRTESIGFMTSGSASLYLFVTFGLWDSSIGQDQEGSAYSFNLNSLVSLEQWSSLSLGPL
jgi:hypothetical protein